MENTIAVVSDPIFLEHAAPAGHPERPERLIAAQQALSAASDHGKFEVAGLPPRDASVDELSRVHGGKYLEALAHCAGKRGHWDADTYFSPFSHAAAVRAAGGCIAMTDALMDGKATHGLAMVRPPGHHARPETAMGFCLLNNVAVAAAHARARGAARVAIVDWDVHHGNGTQEIFEEDPSVLYVSLHQFPFYPGTGSVEEVGEKGGVGATLNVPLSAGANDAAYAAAVDRIIAPALHGFDPDLLLISAGFDAHHRDPLAAMRLTAAGYAVMARKVAAAIPRGARGRLGLVLEGGYDLEGIGTSLQATLEALAIPDETSDSGNPGSISARHGEEIERARASASQFHALG